MVQQEMEGNERGECGTGRNLLQCINCQRLTILTKDQGEKVNYYQGNSPNSPSITKMSTVYSNWRNYSPK